MRGKGARGPPAFSENEINTRARRGNLELLTSRGRRLFAAWQITLQDFTKGRWRIAQSIARGAQFLNTMGPNRPPFRWRARKYVLRKAVRVERSVLDFHTTYVPFLEGAQGRDLKM